MEKNSPIAPIVSSVRPNLIDNPKITDEMYYRSKAFRFYFVD